MAFQKTSDGRFEYEAFLEVVSLERMKELIVDHY